MDGQLRAIALRPGEPVNHPDPGRAVDLGLLMVDAAVREAILFEAAGFNPRPVSDRVLVRELTLAWCRYLGLDEARTPRQRGRARKGPAPWIRDALPELRAVVAYYAVLDLQVPAPGAEATLSAETRREHSPVAQLETGAAVKPPILVARAGRDNPWLNGSIDRFVQAALVRNTALTLLTHPNGQHGFDILDDDARSREIIRATVAFLKERLE